MKAFVNYMIEANLGICFFMLVYQLFLKQETDFQFKRIFLLSALLLSTAIPFFHFDFLSSFYFNTDLPTYWLPEMKFAVPSQPSINKIDAIALSVFILYSVGAIIFLMLFVVRLLKIGIEILWSLKVKDGSIWFVESNNHEVFSFFKYIFIGRAFNFSAIERQQIIQHESVHVQAFHSLDILFINLLGIIFWFNPFIKTYRNQVVQLHEFAADARAVANEEVDDYCNLLAKAALNSSGFLLANHFTNSLTLKRIQMMKTVKTEIAKWKMISITAIAFLFCCLIACSSGDKVFDQVDELPTFGSKPQYNEVYEFISKNLKYPEMAKKKGIEGKVYTQFIVEKNGTVTNVSTVKGIGFGCDEAAADAIKLLPSWNPGKKDGKIVRTSFVLPIEFRLSETKKGD